MMDQPPRTAPVITKTPEPETLQSTHRSQQSPKDPLYARTRERLRELLLSPEAQKVWTAFAPQNVSPTKQVLSYRAISRAIAAQQQRDYGYLHEQSRYKDRVRRAFLGEKITAETVHLFAEAFGFDEHTTQELLELRGAEEVAHANPGLKANLSITTSLYDIYLDQYRQVYTIRVSLIARSLVDDCQRIYSPTVRNEIKDVRFLSPGTSVWDEEENRYRLNLNYPLRMGESIPVDYEMDIVPDVEPPEVLELNFVKSRSSAVIRLFFADEHTAPRTVKVVREIKDDVAGTIEKNIDLPVAGWRASIYLSPVYNETLHFISVDD